MVDIVIRRAERRDLRQLGALGALLVKAHHDFDAKRFLAPEAGVEPGYAWFLGSELENPEAAIFVAERERSVARVPAIEEPPATEPVSVTEPASTSQPASTSEPASTPEPAPTSEGTLEIVGYCYAGIEPRSWKELREEAGFIHDLLVRVEFRGQNIGTRLLEAASEWLAKRGVSNIMLWTAAQNPGAQRLFERLGFRRTMIEMTRSSSPERAR